MERILHITKLITPDEASVRVTEYIRQFEEADSESKEPYYEALAGFFALTDKYNINLSVLPMYLDFFFCAAIARTLDFIEKDESR